MTKIARVTAELYRIALPSVLSDSMHGEIGAFELILATVVDAEGREGVGYTYTVGRNGAAIVASLRNEIAPLLVGEDSARIEHLWHKVWWALHYGGRGGPVAMAISAVDIALWDLRAKRAELPLWKLLGGFDPRVPCYAGGIDLDFDIDRLLAQTESNLQRGFRAIKMKVGRAQIADDVERVAAMRRFLSDGQPLMLDANMKWNVDQAIQASRRFAEYDITWLEEPIIPEDYAGHARIVREGALPIASGENLHSIWEFASLVIAGGVSFPEPDVTACGGVTGFLKVAHLAEAHNLPITSHGAHDITVHLLAAVPNRSFLEAHGFGLERYIAEPLAIENGCAVAPDRPGHGIAFDMKALAGLRAS
jgi:L-alanine-DL-glutamate epimerase-like enolase superfamily enzyme